MREDVVERALSVYPDSCERRRQHRAVTGTSRSPPLALHGGATGADARTFLRWVALRQAISSGPHGQGQQVRKKRQIVWQRTLGWRPVETYLPAIREHEHVAA